MTEQEKQEIIAEVKKNVIPDLLLQLVNGSKIILGR